MRVKKDGFFGGRFFLSRHSLRTVAKLAVHDFRARYAGSYFGIFWAFVQPVVTILVYWFVFSVGFRSGTGSLGLPFVLYLVCGIIPWFYFSDSLTGGTNALLEYSYLVKKVVFPVRSLPLVKLFSALLVHGFFLGFTLVLCTVYGRFPGVYALQLPYYLFCLTVLVLGCVWVTSAVVPFFRDLSQMIAIGLQVGVWLTPIMWIAEDSLAGHPKIWMVLKLNPIYYVVSGYRDSLLFHRFFWERPLWTLYFWAFTIAMLCFGTWVFGRLEEHFADVL